MTEYFIYADNGSKICKRTEDEYGNLMLETTRGTVSFENFQKQSKIATVPHNHLCLLFVFIIFFFLSLILHLSVICWTDNINIHHLLYTVNEVI